MKKTECALCLLPQVNLSTFDTHTATKGAVHKLLDQKNPPPPLGFGDFSLKTLCRKLKNFGDILARTILLIK